MNYMVRFYRKWTTDAKHANPIAEIENHFFRDEMSQMRVQMQEQMAFFTQMTENLLQANPRAGPSSKGKAPLRGRGRAKNRRPYQRKPRYAETEEEDASSEQSYQSVGSGDKELTNNISIPIPVQYQNNRAPLRTDKTTVYVQHFDLQLDTASLDQVDTH